MSNGQVKEFDSPYNLLQKRRSHFKKMVEQTGPIASRMLHQMAEEAHLKKSSQLMSGTDEPNPRPLSPVLTITPL